MSRAIYRAGSRHVCSALGAAIWMLEAPASPRDAFGIRHSAVDGTPARAGWGGTSAAQAGCVQRVLTDWLPLLLLGVYATLTMAVLGSGGSVTMAVGRFVVGGWLSLVSAVEGSRGPTPVGRGGGCRWHLSAAWACAGPGGPRGVGAPILWSALLVGIATALIAARLPLHGDMSHLLPPQTQSVRDLRTLEGRAQVFGTIIVAIESDDPERRGAAARDGARPAGRAARRHDRRDQLRQRRQGSVRLGAPPLVDPDRRPDGDSRRAGAAKGAAQPAVRRRR